MSYWNFFSRKSDRCIYSESPLLSAKIICTVKNEQYKICKNTTPFSIVVRNTYNIGRFVDQQSFEVTDRIGVAEILNFAEMRDLLDSGCSLIQEFFEKKKDREIQALKKSLEELTNKLYNAEKCIVIMKKKYKKCQNKI